MPTIMNNIDLLALIKEDEMRVNLGKRPISLETRLWLSLLLGLILTILANIFSLLPIAIDILLIVVVFLPLLASILLKRIKNKYYRIKYPYAFTYLTNSLGLSLTANKQLSLVDTFQLSNCDEKLLLCIEEAHKYQQNDNYPINPLLYRKKHYDKESLDRYWNLIMSYIQEIEGKDVVYSKEQVGKLCDKYKVWSEISKRLKNENVSDIFSDKKLDTNYVGQFGEILHKDSLAFNKNTKDWNSSDDNFNNSLSYNKYFLYPQSAYTMILQYITMENGGLEENADYNKKYRKILNVLLSSIIWIVGVISVIWVGCAIVAWIKTNSFWAGIAVFMAIGIPLNLLYVFLRFIVEKIISGRFTKYPTIMTSIAKMEGINPDTALNSISSLNENELLKLLLIDKHVFKYPPIIIKPIKDELLNLINKYPNGTQKALDFLADSPQYRKFLVRERTDRKGKHIEIINVHELLYNMLDKQTYDIVLYLIHKEEDIRVYEANFAEANADDIYIKHVKKVFEDALDIYHGILYEWSYDIHAVNYIRHNYDGSNSPVVLKFIEIIYNTTSSWGINEQDIKNKLIMSNKLGIHLDSRLEIFCSSLDGKHIFIMNDNKENSGITTIAALLSKAYEKTARFPQNDFKVLTNINDIDSAINKEKYPYTIFSIKDYKLCSQIGWFHEGDEKSFVNEEEVEYYYWPESSKDELFCEGNYISPYSRCLKYHFESLSQKRICTVGITFSKFRNREKCSIKEEMKDSWCLLNGSIPYFNLYTYIPVNYAEETNFVLTKEEIKNREMIFQFKDLGIEDRVSTSTGKDVYRDLKLVLSKSFNNLDSAMIFFVPSSEQYDYKKRHKKLGKLLMEDFHLRHSFGLLKYTMDGRSSRDERGAVAPQIIFGDCFFKGEQVIIFDDIITSGGTMLHYKSLLESWGAKVIACIALGKTQYDHEPNPIDSINVDQ